MKLKCDDSVQSYFWVDDSDEKNVVSPHFDYIEDAIDWHRKCKDQFYEMMEKKWMKMIVQT